MDTNKVLLYGGGAIAAYFLFLAPKTGAASTNPLSNLFSSSGATGTPTTTGINSGVKGGNGSFYTVSNYAALLSANPNLGNPNYLMTPAEQNQYLANYSDLQTGLPQWVGQAFNGVRINSIADAIQRHWRTYGVAEKRIYLPLQPPSTAAYIPPPANPKSSGGSSTLSTVLGTAVSVLGLILGANDPKLNDKDLELLFTGSKVVFDILPFYSSVDGRNAQAIGDKLTDVLNEYM